MTDITPESLRALADDVSSGQAGMVLFHSARNEIPVALRAAADEIERLQRHAITIQGAAEMLDDGTIRREPSHD